MGTPRANGGLRSEPDHQLSLSAEPWPGHRKPCPSFLFKQLCVCHSCDLETSLDPVSLGLASIRCCLSDCRGWGLL